MALIYVFRQPVGCTHKCCGRECKWTKFKPLSIPLGGVSKIEIDEKAADPRASSRLEDPKEDMLRSPTVKTEIKVAQITL